jgi:hypothetical protein
MSEFTSSNRIKLRITSQLEASKQFLVILIGLAVANAVAEKLKYNFDGSALGLRAVSRDSGSYLLPSKILIDQNDNLYGLLFDFRAHYLDFIVLGIFLIYVTRFFLIIIPIYLSTMEKALLLKSEMRRSLYAP